MRYAIYFVPTQDSPLEAAAARWLGRSIFTGATLPQPSHDGLDISALTAKPRHYGFHGTIVAPFRLAAGVTQKGLAEALETFCANQALFPVPQLELVHLDGFFALVPQAASPRLDTLAAKAVEAFQPFMMPLREEEIARRDAATLTKRQRELLHRWGYPYVMEEFRFHMTLTDRVSPSEHARVHDAILAHFGPVLDAPLAFSAMALCVEPAAGVPFTLLRHIPFEQSRARKALSHG